MDKFLDTSGVQYLWNKIKQLIDSNISVITDDEIQEICTVEEYRKTFTIDVTKSVESQLDELDALFKSIYQLRYHENGDNTTTFLCKCTISEKEWCDRFEITYSPNLFQILILDLWALQCPAMFVYFNEDMSFNSNPLLNFKEFVNTTNLEFDDEIKEYFTVMHITLSEYE